MCMNVSPVNVCVYDMCAWCSQSQKGASDPQELKLGMVVSHLVGAGI